MQERLAEDPTGTFPEIVRAYQDALFSIVLGILGSREDAEDVTQDAFIRAYSALVSYGDDRLRDLRLRPWLIQIAVNLARNRLRRSRPLSVSLDADRHDLALPDSEPQQHVERIEETRRWTRLLGELPVRYRVAVVLRHVEGLSYEEIASVLEKPVGTVKVHVHRGIEALQQILESHEKEVLVR